MVLGPLTATMASIARCAAFEPCVLDFLERGGVRFGAPKRRLGLEQILGARCRHHGCTDEYNYAEIDYPHFTSPQDVDYADDSRGLMGALRFVTNRRFSGKMRRTLDPVSERWQSG